MSFSDYYIMAAEFSRPSSVQSLSIQLLDLKRVFPNDNAARSLSDLVDIIIETHNEEKRKKQVQRRDRIGQLMRKKQLQDETYSLDVESVVDNYSVKMFSYRKSITSNISKHTPNQKKTKTSHYILFFYRETPRRRIFALTTGNAWFVVRQYVSYSFPTEIAKRVANPVEIIQLVRRCLCGQYTQENLLHPGAFELYKTSNLYYLIENFKCVLKYDSSLFRLIVDKSIKKSGRCWIKVTTGGILRIGKRLRLASYPDILDLLDKIVEGEPTCDNNGAEETVDPRFAALHFLKPAHLSKQQLDRLLMNSIFSRWTKGKEQVVDVRHKFVEDYLLSNSFEIKIGTSKYQEIGSSPPVMQDILEKISAEDEDEFKKVLKEGKLRFTDQASRKHKDKIIDCIEGPLHTTSNTYYFKMRKMWYVIEADYLGLLCQDFLKLVKNTLIAPDEEGYLPLPWKGNEKNASKKKKPNRKNSIAADEEVPPPRPGKGEKKGESEEDYCRSYLDVPVQDNVGYFVFDQILPDHIEPCDILKFTEDTLYLYHVKEEFGQNTRDAASQILNAATMIRSVLALNCQFPDYLKKLWSTATTVKKKHKDWKRKLKRRLEDFGENNFYDLFRDLKIVFVYAYLPNPERSFSNALKILKETKDERIVNELIDAGYLDSDQCLTEKFYSTNKDDFKQCFRPTGVTQRTISESYTRLSQSRFSRSTLAKIELIQLSQNLRALGFEFKICEIPKLVDQCSAGNSST